MKPTRELLRASAGLAARRLTAHWLKEAARASRRLRNPGVAEALHDFRVSVRRLRTCLRAYRDYLDKSLAKRLRRKLGELTDRTNAGRDEEVHLQWLRQCLRQPQLPDLEQNGIRLLLNSLEARRRHQQPRLIRDIVRDFEKLAVPLRKQIKRGGRPGKRRRPASQPAFATVIAAILCREARDLHRQLRRVGSVNSPNSAHQARLIAKRMRYLLEPVSPKLPGADAAVARLRQLQDKLGELHDLQTLKAEVSAAVEHTAGDWSAQLIRDASSEIWMAAIDQKLPQVRTCYALVAVMAHIHAEQRRLFEALRRTWLEDRDAAFQKQVQRLVERLSAFGPQVGEA